MSFTKSIITSAKPTALRGGRMRKRGGQVISFAPHFSDLLSGASRVALGGVLILSGVAALSPTIAMAEPYPQKCEGTATILCSGGTDALGDRPVTITVSEPATLITTAPGFGIDTRQNFGGPAISIYGEGGADIDFTDTNGSAISGTDGGIFTSNMGDGNTNISVNGTVTAANVAGPDQAGSDLTSTGISASTGPNGYGETTGPDTGAGTGTISVTNSNRITATTHVVSAHGAATGIAVDQSAHGAVTIVNGPAIVAAGLLPDADSDDQADNDGPGIVVRTTAHNTQTINPGEVTLDQQLRTESVALGIFARQAGDAALSVINTANITASATTSAATSLTGGALVRDNSVELTATSIGIGAYKSNDGEITISNSADIDSRALIDGSITISSGDHIGYNDIRLTANAYGVDARHDSMGDITIANAGTIYAGGAVDTQIDLDAERVTANNEIEISAHAVAVSAYHGGQGHIAITNDGDISAVAVAAADVNLNGLDETYSNSVTTLSAALGISAAHSGEGHITITNNANITANSDAGGTATIGDNSNWDNSSYRNSQATGIKAVHSGDGNIIITNNGTITVDANHIYADSGFSANRIANGTGIQVEHTGKGADVPTEGETTERTPSIAITNAGVITSSGRAVQVTVASDFNSGDIVDVRIINTGTLKSATGEAVFVQHEAAGDIGIGNGEGAIITVSETDSFNAADSGYNSGIDHRFTPEISVTAIRAAHAHEGDIVIANVGTVSATASATAELAFDDRDVRDNELGFRISASGISLQQNDYTHYANGEILVLNEGPLNIAANASAVFAGEDVNGNDTSFSAQSIGISANSYSDGDITVATKGAITVTSSNMVSFTGEDVNYNHAQTQAIAIGIDAEHNDFGTIAIGNYGALTVTAQNSISFDGDDAEFNHAQSEATAIGISAYHNGFSANEKAINILNNGVITVSAVTNVTFAGDDIADNSVDTDSFAVGILATTNNASGDILITNNGKISATLTAPASTDSGVGLFGMIGSDDVSVSSKGSAFGVSASQVGVGDIDIINGAAGTITGSTAAIHAELDNGALRINNAGIIANSSGESSDLAIIAGPYQQGSTGTVAIVNTGTLTGTIRTTTEVEYWGGTDNVIENVSFNDAVTNNGTWNTAGGTNAFGAGDDIVVNTGVLNAANATFSGLERLENNGTLSLANGQVGDTLRTDGDIILTENSNLILDGSGDGFDTVVADGNVALDGTLTLNTMGPRITEGRLNLIQADTVTGSFIGTNINDTLFLDLSLDSSIAGQLDLVVDQVADFVDVTGTANQLSTAAALDGLASGNDLIDELLYMPDAAAANAAFDQLSGETHATLRSSLANDSRLPRNAVLNRLQTREASAVWGDLFYGAGNLDQAKTRATAGSKRDAWGFILGADAAVSETITVGFAGSVINHENDQGLRSSKADAETVNLLAYVGAEAGKARFKLGAGYAWGDINTARSVSFGRFADRLTANYDASLFQAFAELGYRLPLAGGYVEPMANVIYVDTTTDGFTEKGGLAALAVAKRSETTTLSTLGARFSTAQSGIFSINGMAGWQHGFGKLTPTSVMAFAGSDSFTIAGAPQSRDAAVASVEAKFDVNDNTSIGLGYDGVLGNVSQDHAAKLSVRLKF